MGRGGKARSVGRETEGRKGMEPDQMWGKLTPLMHMHVYLCVQCESENNPVHFTVVSTYVINVYII